MNARHYVPCLVVAAVAAVLLGVAGVSSATLVTVGAALACPLVMVLMMRSMGGAHAHQDHAGAADQVGDAK
jgi:choline-glycine betaine transporter